MNEILFLILFVGIVLFSPKIFKDPKWGVLLLVIALPFERFPAYTLPFQWGITVRLSQIIALILIASLLYGIVKKKISFKVSFETVLLFLYLLSAFLSIFVAGNLERAILVWLFTAFVVLVSLIIPYFIENRNDFKKIEKVIYFITLFVTLFGVFQFTASTFGIPDDWIVLRQVYGDTTKRVLGFPRVQSFSLEPLYYANFLLIPFGIFLAKSFKKIDKRIFFILLLITVNFVLTFSRGIYLAIIVTVLVAAVFALKYSTYKKIAKSLSVLGLGVIIGSVMIVFSSYHINKDFSQVEKAKKHATEITEQSISVSERKDTWEDAIVAFRENPVLGVGIGNFGAWQIGFPEEAPKRGWNIVNNETLEVLAETGLLGFLSLMGALFFIFINGVNVFNSSRDEYLRIWAAGLLIAFIGTAVQYQSFSTLYIMHVWVLVGLLIASQKIYLKEKV